MIRRRTFPRAFFLPGVVFLAGCIAARPEGSTPTRPAGPEPVGVRPAPGPEDAGPRPTAILLSMKEIAVPSPETVKDLDALIGRALVAGKVLPDLSTEGFSVRYTVRYVKTPSSMAHPSAEELRLESMTFQGATSLSFDPAGGLIHIFHCY